MLLLQGLRSANAEAFDSLAHCCVLCWRLLSTGQSLLVNQLLRCVAQPAAQALQIRTVFLTSVLLLLCSVLSMLLGKSPYYSAHGICGEQHDTADTIHATGAHQREAFHGRCTSEVARRN
jgi:hypothetical protein